jgi:hypothetical protein
MHLSRFAVFVSLLGRFIKLLRVYSRCKHVASVLEPVHVDLMPVEVDQKKRRTAWSASPYTANELVGA